MAAEVGRHLIWIISGLLILMETWGKVSSQTTEKGKSNSSRPMYRVATVVNEPWMMHKDGVYTGFIADLLSRVAEEADFDYQLQQSTEGTYGKMNYFTGEFDGVVGAIIKGEADIAAADLIATDERSKVLTLTKPFMDSGLRIVIEKPEPFRHAWHILLQPFTANVWILIIVAFVLVGGEMFLIDRFSPYSAQSNSKGREQHCCLHLSDSYLFTFSTFVWQGYNTPPRSTSGRFLAVFWWFFTVCVLLAYTASLTARFLATGNDKPVIPFRTFSEMTRQSEVSYGGWFGMRLDINSEPQATINRYINSRYSYYNDLTDAIKRMRNSDGGYAAIVERYAGEHLTGRNCDLLLLRDELHPIAYSMACSKSHDELCNKLSMAILKLREEGIIYELIKRWWDARSQCPSYSEHDFISRMSTTIINTKSQSMAEMAFAFVGLLVGAVLSIVILIIEVIVHRRRKQPIKSENAVTKEDVDQSGV